MNLSRPFGLQWHIPDQRVVRRLGLRVPVPGVRHDLSHRRDEVERDGLEGDLRDVNVELAEALLAHFADHFRTMRRVVDVLHCSTNQSHEQEHKLLQLLVQNHLHSRCRLNAVTQSLLLKFLLYKKFHLT